MTELKIPEHIAVIMDGNGRWALQHKLSRTQGHIAGEQALLRWIRRGRQIGVKEMSFYTFSTENWSRSTAEVNFLMTISKQIMRNRVDEFIELGCRVKWVGRKQKLWPSVLKELEIISQKTAHLNNMTLNFCINYGGRQEVVDAVNLALKNGVKQVNQQTFSKYLYSPTMRDVDLLIRTSGEVRTSNFLPWHLVYAEMVFIDDYWPDVTETTLDLCLEQYTNRNRRFGQA